MATGIMRFVSGLAKRGNATLAEQADVDSLSHIMGFVKSPETISGVGHLVLLASNDPSRNVHIAAALKRKLGHPDVQVRGFAEANQIQVIIPENSPNRGALLTELRTLVNENQSHGATMSPEQQALLGLVSAARIRPYGETRQVIEVVLDPKAREQEAEQLKTLLAGMVGPGIQSMGRDGRNLLLFPSDGADPEKIRDQIASVKRPPKALAK